MPAAKKAKAMRSHRTPHTRAPIIGHSLANCEASDSFTFRKIRSVWREIGCQYGLDMRMQMHYTWAKAHHP